MDSLLPDFALEQPWHIQLAHWAAHVAGLALGKALGLVLIALGLALLLSPFWIAWKVARALLRVAWRCVRWGVVGQLRQPPSAAAHGKGAEAQLLTESADGAASAPPPAAVGQGLRRRPRPAVTATAATEEGEAVAEAGVDAGMQATDAEPPSAHVGSGAAAVVVPACCCMPGELPCRLHHGGGLPSVVC